MNWTHVLEVFMGLSLYTIFYSLINFLSQKVNALARRIEALAAHIREQNSVKAPSINDPPIHDPEDK